MKYVFTSEINDNNDDYDDDDGYYCNDGFLGIIKNTPPTQIFILIHSIIHTHSLVWYDDNDNEGMLLWNKKLTEKKTLICILWNKHSKWICGFILL
jgi:hypothetical protein